MTHLRRRVRAKQKLYPDLYDTSNLHLVRTIRDFDNLYTATYGGFADAEDYYRRASSLPLIKHIVLPTLIIHAEDDPFIPFAPLRDPSIAANPNVLLLAPEHGGHVGFIAAETRGEDRFWAENRVVEFCKHIQKCAALSAEI
jgi:predicted alpha/beta-fold hydrolase